MARGLTVLMLLGAFPSSALALGHVQFRTQEGVAIRLDGREVGVTRGADGLVVRKVGPGAHRYEARLSGYTTQFGVVVIGEDVVTVKHLLPWQPIAKAPPEDPSPGIGTLIVDTLPVNATIQARHLGWKDKVEKGEGSFIARELPAGKRKFTFCNEEKCLDYWVDIPNASFRKLLIDFDPGEVFDLTEEFVAGWKRATNRCGQHGDKNACRIACESDSSLTPALPSLACDALNQKAPSGAVPASTTFTAPDLCGVEPDGAPGRLSIRSRQVVTLLLEGHILGRTPLTDVEIPSGCHELTAITKDGKRHPLTVRLEPGQRRHIKLTF